MEKPRLCENCGRQMESDEIAYWVRLEIFASPEPPTLTPEDLDQDHTEKMKALIAQMEKVGPEECEAQVFEAYRFVVCGRCRDYFHDHLKERRTTMNDEC
jgi:predicted PP-loop superfamily ATPase